MASKSKKRRRVLGASCILAALIIAGSSFAWFTSKDEVTNRLSANADYGVKLVESFAPPANWLPGQTVEKDVYAVNTGTIAAFVRETITSKMTITQEVRVDAELFNYEEERDNFIKLTPAERYSVEAGSYLAYAPARSSAARMGMVGKQVVAFNVTDNTKLEGYEAVNGVIKDTNDNVIGITTDFAPGTTPDDNGIYVFRRTIDITGIGSRHLGTQDDLRFATEDFTYEAYYYYNGDFYKVMLTYVPQDDKIDRADDADATDGLVGGMSPQYIFFKEVQSAVTPELYYDAENHRLVAKVAGFGGGIEDYFYSSFNDLASSYNGAVHEYEGALILLYDAIEQYEDMQDTEKQKYLDYISKLIATSKAEQEYVNELNNYNNLKTSTSTALEELKNQINSSGNPATVGDSLEYAAKALYGDTYYASYKPDSSVTVPALNADTGIGDDYSTASVIPDCDVWADDTAYDLWKTTNSVPSSGKFFRYAEAKHAYEKSIHNEDDRIAADQAFLAELKAYCTAMFPADSETYDYFATVEQYAEYLRSKSDEANNYIDKFVYNGVAYGGELHGQYYLRARLLQAETEYNDAVELYKTMAEQVEALQTNYESIKGLREASKGNLYGDMDIGTNVPKTTAEIDAYTADDALNTDVSTWATKPDSYYYKYIKAKDDELKAKKAYDDAKGTAADDTDTTALGAKKAKEDAEKAVARAKANLDNAKMRYELCTDDYNKTGDIIIYVNLRNDTTVGGTKDKWQLVPVKTLTNDLTNDTAVFYYTGILQGGETSAQLIDSVELDKDVTQYMYKSFDFDLDVKMDSAQVAYGEDDITLQATPANDQFGNVTPRITGANVTLSDPTDLETALTWDSKSASGGHWGVVDP